MSCLRTLAQVLNCVKERIMRTIKIAMLGFGNAGRAFAKLILDKQEEIRRSYDCAVVTTAIATRSRGTLVNSEGIDLGKALADAETDGRFDPQGIDYSGMTAMEVAAAAEYDVLFELTPLEIFTGQPAIDHIRTALGRGKHAVTANKGPIAWAYEELRDLAEKQEVCFFYETTVMDGTPVFNLVDETLRLCRITGVSGILNSTTNFILEELAAGKEYDEVIREGKERGFVEADPSLDVEGWDAAAKTAALLNVLMRAGITPNAIDRKGIEDITVEQIRDAAARGKVIKLLCSGTIVNGIVIGKVAPTEIDRTDLLATIEGTSSVVSITTDLMGTISVVEHDPEIEQTGYGVFGDLIRVIAATSCQGC
jgi:homoserine dehydrogenase